MRGGGGLSGLSGLYDMSSGRMGGRNMKSKSLLGTLRDVFGIFKAGWKGAVLCVVYQAARVQPSSRETGNTIRGLKLLLKAL